MKLTDDIVKALHGCIEDGYESVSDFARLANVSANTITKYLRRETLSIKNETWEKLDPLLRPYLPKSSRKNETFQRPSELTADQKVLLDAFTDLEPDVQKQKLLEIVELAKKNIARKREQSGH